MLTKAKLPILIAIVCGIELSIYFWSVWTSTLDLNNFFAIESAFVFDKAARLAGRVSSILIFIILMMVGYEGLIKIYSDKKKKESFFTLITLFTCNHLIHLLFVFLRFRSHGESLAFDLPVNVGGTIHGVITFASIIIIPVILWSNKQISKPIYVIMILYLFNISSFFIKTFLGKVNPPEHPAYHNQLGVVLIAASCLYILYRVYHEIKINQPQSSQL